MHITEKRFWVILATIAVFAFGIFLTSCAQEEIVDQNVWALGVSLGGLPKQEALSLIRQKASEIQKGPLVFKAGGLSFEVPSERLEIEPDTDLIEKELEEHVGLKSNFFVSLFKPKEPKYVMASAVSVVRENPVDVIDEIAAALSKESLPERYGFVDRDLVILSAEKGQIVTSDNVLDSLKRLEGTTVEVEFEELEPVYSETLSPLGLVALSETKYKLDETDRNVNLALAAAAVHGQMLLPGETYSFNREAGERSVQRGYRYANVVVGNRLVPDVGGGICQITTTLFNAAAESGLDFPELHAHGIPVDYADPGCDAAVAWDYLDLKITNGFDTPVVFGAWVEDGAVSVKVFGRPNESTYELEPVILEQYPEEGMNPGLLVETYRVEKQGGEIIKRQLLVRSRYQPSYPK